MWKIISLSALLIVAQATDIEQFYGDWTEVAFYPVFTYVPVCIRFTFEKSTENEQCTYADGKNVTKIQVTIMTEVEDVIHRVLMPLRVVDTLAEVMPTLNMTIKCGDEELRVNDRAVAKLVNEDYFIFYSLISKSREHTRSEVEPNSAMLFARNVVSANKLSNVMMSIDELKNRRGAQMCVAENYSRYKSTENEVGND